MGAFLLLSWSTYREMDEERRKRYVIRLSLTLDFTRRFCGDKD